MEWVIDQLSRVWPVISQAPLFFAFVVVLLFLLTFLINKWIYGERLERAEQLMELYKEQSAIAQKSPKEIARLVDAWEKAQKSPVIGKQFLNETVPLDGFSYSHCTFKNVTFVFNGDAPFDLAHNQIYGAWIKTNNPKLSGLLKLLIALKMLDPKVQIQHD